MAVISNGTTLIDNGILDAAVPTGSLILLSTQTASASATISFTSGIDSTYDSYVFKFYNIHPATDGVTFEFQGSTNGGSTYGVTITSSVFQAYHQENDAGAGIQYATNNDLAQLTSFQKITGDLGNLDDECGSGILTIYNPSNTTFVKHFISTENGQQNNEQSVNIFASGYFNTTSAIDAIQFKMSSGNIDSGVIKLYGIGG
jgi:hypothetical protein